MRWTAHCRLRHSSNTWGLPTDRAARAEHGLQLSLQHDRKAVVIAMQRHRLQVDRPSPGVAPRRNSGGACSGSSRACGSASGPCPSRFAFLIAVTYFQEGEFRPDPKRSDEWNRGGYLVEGLGHCGTCHTAINALGGSESDKAFAGGLIPMQNWYAPSLTNNKEAGLGEWSLNDIEDLLRAGASQRGAVYGPAAEP